MLTWPMTVASPAPGSSVRPPRETCLFPRWLNARSGAPPSTLGCLPRSLHEAGPSGFLTQASMRDGETQDVLRPAPDTPFNFH